MAAFVPFNNAAGFLTWTQAGFVQLTWHPGPRPWPAFYSIMEQVYQALQTTGCQRLLVQQHSMEPYTPEELYSLIQEWIPRLAVRGHNRYVAVVVPANMQAYAASVHLRAQISRLPVVIRAFEQLLPAESWLQRVGSFPCLASDQEAI